MTVQPWETYRWEVETEDGVIFSEENPLPSSGNIPITTKRVSFIPLQGHEHLPRHDFFLPCQFSRRFNRAIKNVETGVVTHYFYVLVFFGFRVYIVGETGQVMITPPNFEYYP